MQSIIITILEILLSNLYGFPLVHPISMCFACVLWLVSMTSFHKRVLIG